MQQEKAQKIFARLNGYIDWVAAKYKTYLILHGVLVTLAMSFMVYANFDTKFLLSFGIPAVAVFASIWYYSKILNNARKIKEREREIMEMLMASSDDWDLKVDGDYTLSEVFEYKVVFENLNKGESIAKEPLMTIEGLKALTNPLPYMLIIVFGWVMAVEIIVTAVGVYSLI